MARKSNLLEEVEARADILQIARILSLDIKTGSRGAAWRCQCPVHGGNQYSLCITPDKSLFYCFPDHTGGKSIDLVAHTLGIGKQEAVFYLAERLGIGTHVRNVSISAISSSSNVLPFVKRT